VPTPSSEPLRADRFPLRYRDSRYGTGIPAPVPGFPLRYRDSRSGTGIPTTQRKEAHAFRPGRTGAGRPGRRMRHRMNGRTIRTSRASSARVCRSATGPPSGYPSGVLTARGARGVSPCRTSPQRESTARGTLRSSEGRCRWDGRAFAGRPCTSRVPESTRRVPVEYP
jgi:hypothetical protein